jgi:hypothetical protein
VRKVLDLGRKITWGNGGEGLALEIESFVGPVKLHEPIGECNLGPTKPYARGRINHRCINSYYPSIYLHYFNMEPTTVCDTQGAFDLSIFKLGIF